MLLRSSSSGRCGTRFSPVSGASAGGTGTVWHSVGGAIVGRLVEVALLGSMWDCVSDTSGAKDWAS